MKKSYLLIATLLLNLSALSLHAGVDKELPRENAWAISNNTIGSPQVICSGTIPAPLLGSLPTGGLGPYTYQWQISTVSASAGFANIGAATAQDYAPGALAANRWYRRIVGSAGLFDTTAALAITVTPLIATNTIAVAQTICINSAPSPLTGSSPTGGNGVFTFQWQISPDNITFTDISLATAQGYAPPVLATTTWYRRVVKSGGCSSNSASVKITITPVITNNTATADQSICTGQTPLALTGSTPAGGTGTFTYAWQSSTVSAAAGFATAAGVTNGKNYSPPSLSQTTWFRRLVSSGGCVDSAAVVQVTVVTVAPGNPTVYGNGVWNAYLYSDNAFGTYAGYYTEPLLSFISSSRYAINQSPSTASGYQGCQVANTNYSMSLKRTNFVADNYRIDLTAIDDNVFLFINGVQVYTRGCCITPPATVNNVWTGFLGATDQVEIRWTQGTGNAQLGFNFTSVTPAPLNAGQIGNNESICFGELPYAGFVSVTPATSGCTLNGYQWQSSIDSITWIDIAGATALTYTETAVMTQTRWYRRVTSDACKSQLATLPVKITVNVVSPGDPTVFGDNTWIAYEYQYPAGNTNFAAATYKGYYTEPTLSFDSRTRWANGASPSNASGYQGCYVAPTYHWVSYKRTNFTPAVYQIDLPAHDDDAYVYLNGLLLFSHVGCCDVHTNIWTGPLGATDQIEYRVLQGGGGAYAAISLTPVTPAPLTPGTITPSQTICAGNIPPTPLTQATAPTGGCTIKNYGWEYSADNGVSWTTLSGATASAYTITTGIYSETLYRRIVYDVCGNSATGLPDTIYMNNAAPGNPAVFGNNTWNVYCYQDVNFSLYAGYYTEPSLTFTTTTRYGTNNPPSQASGYLGCQLINTYYSASVKRTGFTTGTYQIDVTNHDDDTYLYINGTLVFSHVGCCDAHVNVWTGTLNPADQIEIRWRNNAGPGQLGIKFTNVSATPLVPGSIAAYNPNLCASDIPVINSVTAAGGGCPSTYFWQYSTDAGVTWTTIVGATAINYTATVSPAGNIQYRRGAVDNCGATVYTAPASFIQGAGAVGNPTVFGNGAWNVYAYNANGAAFASATYLGYYTEPLLSFSSLNRWGNNNSPSDASGYLGCQVDADNHWVSYKRTNITPGTYQIDMPTHDDDVYLYINGVLVFSHVGGCCDVHNAVWTGAIVASDQIELRWRENYGGSNGALNFTPATPSTTITGGAISAGQIICSNTAPAAFTNVDSAHSTCFIYYQWQSQTNCSGPWNNIAGATGLIYAPGVLASKTCFRRAATNACGITAYSNTLTVDLYSTSLTGGSAGASQAICSGSTPAALNNITLPTGGDGAYTYQWQSSADNVGWTNIPGATGVAYTPAALTATTYYRRTVTSCGGALTANTASVTITVSSLPTITAQPGNASACAGANTTISMTATGAGLGYQWQVNTGSGWGNISNGALYSGVTTNTLAITGAIAGMNGYQYRVNITGTCTPALTSATSTLTIGATPVIGAQPVNTAACAGATVNFSVTASGSGLTYQWQQKIGAGAWTSLTNTGIYSGTTSNTLTMTGVTTGMNGYNYQCIITSSCLGTATTTPAAMTVVAAITNNIAADQALCSGSATAATLTGNTGGGYTYLWQSSTVSAASGFVAASGTNNGSNYAPGAVGANTWYQRVVTNAGCSSTSNVVSISFNSTPIAISAQPTTQTVCAGSNATYSVTASGPGTLTYQWQEYNGSAWSILSNAGLYSGTSTATLLITGATAGMNNYQYRVRLFSSGCTASSLYSSNATLLTNAVPTITASNPDIITCAGNGVSINVSATGLGLSYQWQQNSGSGWNNLSNFGVFSNVNGNSLRITGATTSLTGTQYRCQVTGTCSPFIVYSGTTNLTVNPVLGSNSISNSQTLCAGTPVPFTGSTPTGGDGTYTYQWQQNPGSGWTNIPGATGIGYTPGPLSQTTQYLRTVSGGTCNPINSIAITVTINPPTSTADPRDTIVCAKTNAAFTVNAIGTNLSYQWQVNSGSGFTNVINGIQYTGATAATVNVLSPAYSLNGYQYRCLVAGNCSPLNILSNAASLTVNPVAIITAQPANKASCQGSTVSFSVTATGTPIGYQWMEKVGAGAFLPVSNGGIYSGANSPSLTLTGISTAMNNNQYYCVLTMGTCPVNTATASLTVNLQPTLVITDPTAVCAPATVNLTLPAITAGSSFAGGTLTYWNDLASTSSLSGPAVVGTTGVYYMRVGTSPVCYDIKPVNVTVYPVISNNTISAPQTICTGTSAALLTGSAPAGGNGAYSYQWQQSADSATWSNISGALSSTYNPGTLSVTTFFRRVVSGFTCSSNGSAGIRITVVAYPVATISYAGSPFCAVGTATPVRTGQAGGTYSSTTGLVINSTTGLIDLATSVPGPYIVTYSFTNGTCASSTTASVQINGNPALVINNPAAVCAPATVNLTAAAITAGSASGLTYTYFTDALCTTPLAAPAAVTTTGTYYIKGTAITGCSSVASVSVTVNPKPSVVITNPAAVCAPGLVNITVPAVTSGSTIGLTYTYFKDAAATLPLTNPNAIALGGVYYIKGSTLSGCSDIQPVTVVVNPLPFATIVYPGSTFCTVGSISPVLAGQPGGLYYSTPGLTINSATGAIDLSTSIPGFYTVFYSFSNGPCANLTSTPVNIANPALVTNNPAAVCSPNAVDLTSAAVTAGSASSMVYSYYADPAGVTTLASPNAVTGSGTYYIRGTITATGCMSDIVPVVVTVNAKPSVTAVSDNALICKGSQVVLTATSPGNSIEWLNVVNNAVAYVNPVVLTTYTAVATNSLGCSDTTTVTVDVKKFSVELTAAPDPILSGNTMNFTTTGNFNYDVIAWSPANLFTDQTAKNQQITVIDTSKYFSVIARSDEGCLDTATVEVKVNTNTKDFFIPNAFTPNGDGNNDLFRVYGSSVREANLRVFNQWGQLIFESKDPQKGWDGNYGGRPQPVGVFVYVVKVTFYDNSTITKKGTVNLIR